jgi:hypothetical protein
MPPGWQIPDLHQWGGMRPAGIAPYPVRVAFVGVLDCSPARPVST